MTMRAGLLNLTIKVQDKAQLKEFTNTMVIKQNAQLTTTEILLHKKQFLDLTKNTNYSTLLLTKIILAVIHPLINRAIGVR